MKAFAAINAFNGLGTPVAIVYMIAFRVSNDANQLGGQTIGANKAMA